MKQVYLAAYGTPTPPNVQAQPTTPAHETPRSPYVQSPPMTSAYGTPTTPSVQAQPMTPDYPLSELETSICISIINLIEIINTNQVRVEANDVQLVMNLYLEAGAEHCKQSDKYRQVHFLDVSNMFRYIFGENVEA